MQQTEFLLSSWTVFCPFTPLTAQKIKISKQWKNSMEMSSFYTIVPKTMIICYTVSKIWPALDVIAIFHFGWFFCLFTPLTAPKMKSSKKWKKHMELSSFNMSLPKIMIICHTVSDIWPVSDVIFYFGQFFALLPRKQPKLPH